MLREMLQLDVELLERRLLMAGNVTAVFTGAGDLRITGDNESNVIDIAAIDQDTISIDPRGTTTVNGGLPGRPVLLDAASVRDLKISMKGGDDIVYVTTEGAIQSFRNGSFNGGSGNDFIRIDFINFTSNLKVTLASGAAGADRFGSGVDQRAIIGKSVRVDKNVSVRGSSTNDWISVDGNPGAGNMVITGSLRISTSSGNDFVEVEDTDILRSVSVNLGSGDDSMRLQRTETFQRVVFNGGAGTDMFDDEGGNVFLVSPSIRGFEV